MSSGNRSAAGSVPSASNPVLLEATPELGQPAATSGDGPSPVKPKRRRRAPTLEDKPSQNQTFYFVDSSSSSREKRAHVMRHHVQEKRRQRKHSTAGDSNVQSNRPIQQAPWQGRLEYNDDVDVDKSDDSSGNGSLPPTGYSPIKPTSQVTDLSQPPSPVTLLDASRKDPFDTLPILTGKEDQELADYWTNKLTYWSGQNKYMKNRTFRAAMSNPLAFQAVILTYCARWKSQLYGLEDNQAFRLHFSQASKGIEDALNGTTQCDEDSLAMALTGLALQEDRFGSRQTAQSYAHQAVQVLRPRTGCNNEVEVLLHYVRYVMTPPSRVIDVDGQRWLITFLRGAEELMREHCVDKYLSAVPQRRQAFQMEGPLFPLLSSGPRPTQVPIDSHMFVVRNAPTQEVCQTAALIYITAALWDFQDSPNKTRRFLEQLCATVQEHGLDRQPATETLVWLLLEERHDPDLKDAERGWSTGELLKTHKQLRPDLQFYFNEMLMSFLMLTPPIRGIDAFERELEAVDSVS